jgi:hypothetical protein
LANCSLNQLSLEQPTVRPARGVRHVYMVWAPPGSRSDITKHQPSQHRRLGWNCHGVATLLYRFVRAIATLPRTPCTYVCSPPRHFLPLNELSHHLLSSFVSCNVGTSAPRHPAPRLLLSLSPLADGERPPFMHDGHVVGCHWCCCFRGWPFKIWGISYPHRTRSTTPPCSHTIDAALGSLAPRAGTWPRGSHTRRPGSRFSRLRLQALTARGFARNWCCRIRD